MSDQIVNRDYLAKLLGIEGDGTLAEANWILERAAAELSLASDLLRRHCSDLAYRKASGKEGTDHE